MSANSTISLLFDNRPRFRNKYGKGLYYICHTDEKVSCWDVINDGFNGTKCKILEIPITDVPQSELEKLGVWKQLKESVRELFLNIDESNYVLNDANDADNKPVKRSRKKNNDYQNLPEFLECKCGRQTKANYSYLSKKAEKAGISLGEMIEGYQCQKCNPTKGRKKTNDEFSDLPKTLKCACGHEVTANYVQLSKKAEKNNVSLDSLIKGYQCQKCNPTKGRKKGVKIK